MADKAWKRFERECAKDLGTQRIPVTGIDRDGEDWEQAMFCYQGKLRGMIPKFLFDWLGGICARAASKQKIGVLVLNRPRKPRREALVVVRWADWVALHGEPKAEQLDAIKSEVSK